MAKIEFPKPTRELLIRRLSQHMKDELAVDLGGFDAEFLFDFIGETMGAYYYNQGLADAQAIFRDKVETITEAIYEIEQPLRG
jgi:uncharacterized protein (DUF2164 family)